MKLIVRIKMKILLRVLGTSQLLENQILILSKHLNCSITTIEQSLCKQLTSHWEELLKIGVPEK